MGNIPFENSEDKFDKFSYKGAIRHTLKTLITAYPHLKVFLITPIYRFFPTESVTETDCETGDIKTNSLGKTLIDFKNALIEVANEYKVPYMNLYDNLGINEFNRSYYFSNADGTHPNLDGRKLLACRISGELISKL